MWKLCSIFASMSDKLELITDAILDPALKLNERERKFCDAVADGASVSEAVTMAGYESKIPSRYGRELMAKRKIRDEVQRLIAEREGYAKIDEVRVLKEFMTIVNADIADYIDEDGMLFSPEQLKELPAHKTRAIQSIKQTVGKSGVTTEVKLYDKLTAIDKVARHVGFYRDEEVDKKPTINLVLPGALLNIS